MLGQDTTYSTYWVTVKPQMENGMTKGYEVEFNNRDDAFDKYDEFVDLYGDDVQIIEENHIVVYRSLVS